MDMIVSRDLIARQASAAAERHIRTGEDAQNPFCAHLQPEHHAEFARRFYCTLQRLQDAEQLEGSAT